MLSRLLFLLLLLLFCCFRFGTPKFREIASSGLLANFPTDPLGNCGAGWHPYEFKCRYFDCNANVSGPLTAEYPVFVTEWAPGFPQSNRSESTATISPKKNWGPFLLTHVSAICHPARAVRGMLH